jgi:hemolysin activation/secretion protein
MKREKNSVSGLVRVTGYEQSGRYAVAAVAFFASLASSSSASSGTSQKDVTPTDEARVVPKSSEAPASSGNRTPIRQKPAKPVRFDIDDFVVEGANTLTQIEVEEAIYPFLGPGRTAEDVEKARAALEKAYRDKGYQTVSVAVPQQVVGGKVVVLKVAELKVGRLRVKNARYFDLDKIKSKASSFKEGSLPNFAEVAKDIVALNQWPDRRITPALRAGVTPGTVDVDLNVEDKVPLHGSVELNNRRSPNTTPLRLSATVHYDNLWQLGHSLSFAYLTAPRRTSDTVVFSGSYLARIPDVDWLSVLVYGLKSKSNVATVGGMNVVGPGGALGARAVITLPAMENLFHTVSIGLDYKHFGQTVTIKTDSFSSPITYYPLVASYSGAYQAENFTTQINVGLTLNMRTPSSGTSAFDNKRAYASGSFAHFNLDLSHTQELPEGLQLYGRLQGQIADGPLVSSEQLSLGGLDTVRGYLESEVLGDNGAAGRIELRSPNIGAMLQDALKREAGEDAPRFDAVNEWRIFGFTDRGVAAIIHPLPEQQAHFNLWSYGVGAHFKVFDMVNGLIIYSMPMIAQTYTRAKDPHLNFRLWSEF